MFSSLEPLAPEPEQAEGLIAQAGGPASTQLANMAEQLKQQLFIIFRRQVKAAATVQRRQRVIAANVQSRRQVNAATVQSRRQVTAATVQSRRQVTAAKTVQRRRRRSTEEKDL